MVTESRIDPNARWGFYNDKRNKIQIPNESVNFTGFLLRFRLAQKNDGNIISALLVAQKIHTAKTARFLRLPATKPQFAVQKRVKTASIEVAGRIGVAELFGGMSHSPLRYHLKRLSTTQNGRD